MIANLLLLPDWLQAVPHAFLLRPVCVYPLGNALANALGKISFVTVQQKTIVFGFKEAGVRFLSLK